MTKKLYEKYNGDQVTDGMLKEASRLFSENYGIWPRGTGPSAGAFAKEGEQVDFMSVAPADRGGGRVKITKDRLRAQYLPESAACSYVRVTVDDHLAGNAFACYWTYNHRSVCWITQLVVHRDYRERGLAVGLLNELRQDGCDIYGLVSSHAAACLAAAKAFGGEAPFQDPPRELGSNSLRYHRRSFTGLYRGPRGSDHAIIPDQLRQGRETLWQLIRPRRCSRPRLMCRHWVFRRPYGATRSSRMGTGQHGLAAG